MNPTEIPRMGVSFRFLAVLLLAAAVQGCTQGPQPPSVRGEVQPVAASAKPHPIGQSGKLILRKIRSFDGLPGGFEGGASFTTDGERVAICAPGQTKVTIWDVHSGRSGPVITAPGGEKLWSASFSPDGALLLTTGQRTCAATIWDARTGAFVRTIGPESKDYSKACFLPDGRRVITTRTKDAPRIWDVKSGSQLLSLPEYASRFGSVAVFSLNGRYLGFTSRDGPVVVDSMTGKVVFRPGDRFEGLPNFSPDSCRVCCRERHGPRFVVLEIETGEVVGSVAHPHAMEGVFLRDGARLVTSDSMVDEVAVWEIAAGKKVFTIKVEGHQRIPHGYLRVATPSPDGRFIMTRGLTDNAVTLWDAADGSELTRLVAPDMLHGSFSHDGRFVLTMQQRAGSSMLDCVTTVWETPASP